MSGETYIIRIAKSPWSNFYIAAVAAAATAAAAAEASQLKTVFRQKLSKAIKYLGSSKKVTESHDALETIKLTIRQSNISV